MSLLGPGILAVYYLCLGILAFYGCHRIVLLCLYRRARGRLPPPVGRLDPLPRVTVQLPIYNEIYVVGRLIRAVCALQYPRDRLEIQVLDDSDDETTPAVARLIPAMRAAGHDIVHLRRGGRDGYKAGALAHGLERAKGELIAVLDADFLPAPGFLLDLVHQFSHPRVGMVQARWGHLNGDYSLLTRVQSIFLDGHFVIEHAARHRSGRFFNFNGTAGIWRRACIDSAGGWQADTLTEDLDLSYRAQLKGWQFVFLPDVIAPAELPADLDAFKSQQYRWARGSLETARKVLPALLRARLPLTIKLEGLVHLSNNVAYCLIVFLALLILPVMMLRRDAGWAALLFVDLPLFLVSTGSVWTFYLASQREMGVPIRAALRRLPLLTSVGIGLALNNGRALAGAFCGGRAEFIRTPKHGLRGISGTWRGTRYPGRRPVRGLVAESLFGLYFTGATAYALASGLHSAIPFLLFFQTGFVGTCALSLARLRGQRPPGLCV